MEAALALCSLVVVLVLAVGAVAAAAASVRCHRRRRASWPGSRLAASPSGAGSVAAELAPSGARLELTRADDTVTAEVSVQLVRPLPVRIGGRAVAALEPGVGPP